MKKQIAIVGAGALGSHVVQAIRNFDATITVLDHDRVEQKNVLAQFHGRQGIRRNKAQSIQQAMKGVFGTTIKAVPHKVIAANAPVLFKDMDLVIDCTDNIAAREIIQQVCREEDIPCLHGCLSADGTFARIIWTEHFVPDPEGTEGEATCEDGEQLPFFALAGAQVAVIAQVFLKSGKKVSLQLNPTNNVRIA